MKSSSGLSIRACRAVVAVETGERSIPPGPIEAVGERDRRRSVECSPNSRQNRRSSRRSSSHLQGWDSFINDSIVTFVGVDISKQGFDAARHDEPRVRRFENTTEERQAFLSQLPQPGTCLVVLEATGGYERALVADLTGAGQFVAVINPQSVRNFARALGVLAKTDRIDAQMIARFAQTVRPVPRA